MHLEIDWKTLNIRKPMVAFKHSDAQHFKTHNMVNTAELHCPHSKMQHENTGRILTGEVLKRFQNKGILEKYD